MKSIAYIATLLVVLSSCVTVGVVTLDSDNLFELEEKIIVSKPKNTTKLLDYNNGKVADFEKEGINNWWGSSKLQLIKKDGNLVVNAVGVGKEYDRFGYNFVPTVDFTETNILKVRVKAKGDRLPTLRIDLKDRNGYVTNSQDSKARLILCEDYISYYFRYEGRFKQSWPFKADVSPDQIAQLEIFINPGGENFTGQLFIDEIVPVTEEQMWAEIAVFTPPCDILIDNNFDDNIKPCWSNSDVYSLSHKEGALFADCRGAGSGWQSFGMGFSMTALGEKPLIQIKAKVIGEQAAQLRVDLVDFSGNVTNGDAIEFTITNDGIYRLYTFDYQDKMFQGWPTATKVDNRYLNELMFFLNPGGPDFTGKIFIDEVKILDASTAKEWKLPLGHKVDSSAQYTLFNPSTSNNTWWAKNDKATIELSTSALTIKPLENSLLIGTGVDPIDVFMHSKLDLEVSRALGAKIQLQLMDNKGVKTSIMAPIEAAGSSAEHLVYDLSQLVKSNIELNPRMITAIVFHIEQPGKDELTVRKIQVLK